MKRCCTMIALLALFCLSAGIPEAQEWMTTGDSGTMTVRPDGILLEKKSGEGHYTFFNRRVFPVEPGKRYRAAVTIAGLEGKLRPQLMLGFNPGGKPPKPYRFAAFKGDVSTLEFTAGDDVKALRIHLVLSGTGSLRVTDIALTELTSVQPGASYQAGNFSAAYLAELRRELPAKIAAARKEFAGFETRLPLLASGHPRERVAKRLELARRLLSQGEEKLAAADTDSTLFARRIADELELFRIYFADEFKLAEEYAALPEGVRINVRDFGATGDGKADDSAAFEKALAALAKLPAKSQLFIPRGNYLLDTPVRIKRGTPLPDAVYGTSAIIPYWHETDVHLALVGLQNQSISGEEGSTLLFGKLDVRGIGMVGCRNVILKDLTLAFRDEPFTQGTILESNPADNTFLWKLSPGFPAPTEKRFRFNGCGQTHLADGSISREGSGKFIEKVEALGDGVYRFTLRRAFSSPMVRGLEKGRIFVIPDRDSYLSAVFVYDSGFCAFESVRILNSPASAFACGKSTALSYINCVIEPAPGRLMSSNADGIHAWNNVGVGPYIAGCRFRNMGDDAFNTYYRGQYLLKAKGNELYAPAGVRPGGRIIVVDPATGVIKAEAGVTAETRSEWKENRACRKMTLDTPLPADTVTYSTLGIDPYTPKQVAEKNAGVRDLGREPDVYFAIPESGVGSVLSGNDFRDNRNNAIVVQGSSALVEGNRLDNFSIAIRFGAFLTWKEGPPPYNLIIRNNDIANSAAAIHCDYQLKNRQSAASRPMFGVEISGNRFRGNAADLRLSNIEGLRLDGNAFTGGLFFDNVGSVAGSGNRIPGAAGAEAINTTERTGTLSPLLMK